jgi:cytochrome c5
MPERSKRRRALALRAWAALAFNINPLPVVCSARPFNEHTLKINRMMKKILFASIMAAAVACWSMQADDIKKVYETECQKCHGADGKGATKMGKKLGAKDYTDPKFQDTLKDDKMFKVIKEGLKEGDKTLMKPSEGITDEQIKALVKYMRDFKKK